MSSCAWVVCSVYVFCSSSAIYASSDLSASASAILCLCWVVRFSFYVYVSYAYASSASFVACLLFVCLGRLLRLHPLWLVCCLCLVRFVCVCVCNIVPILGGLLIRLCLCLLCLCLVRVFYGLFAVCMYGLSAPSAFSVPCLLRLHLCLLRLYLCLRLLLVVSVLFVFFKILML